MNREDSKHLTVRQKRVLSALSFFAFLALSAVLFWYIGEPLLKFRKEPELFRDFIDSYGAWGRIVFLGLVIIQVVIAVIPGEPLEIGAGYAFGAVEGTVLCVIGITVGSIIVFVLVRTVGIRMVEAFFPIEKIRSLKFLQNAKRFNEIAFIVFFDTGYAEGPAFVFCGPYGYEARNMDHHCLRRTVSEHNHLDYRR